VSTLGMSLSLLVATQSAMADEGVEGGSGERASTPPANTAAPSPPAKPLPPVVIIAPPPPEVDDFPSSEPRSSARVAAEPGEPIQHRFEFGIGATAFPAALQNVRFSGTGVSKATGQRAVFAREGRAFGLRHPTFWGGELTLGYRHSYFGVLVSGSIATVGKADSTPTDPQSTRQIGAGEITAYGGGVEAFGTVPVGPITLSLGAAAGIRGFSAPLLGFEPQTCTRRTRRGGPYTYPCPETATTPIVPWVQPRIRFDVALESTRSVFLGGFVGVDALGDRSLLGGVVMGFRIGG